MRREKFARLITMVALAALFGGMLFFATIMAPLVFGALPPHIADKFIRATFPRYYLYVVITSAITASGLALRGNPRSAIAALFITAVSLFLWLDWIPYINALHQAGKIAAFNRAHRISVYAYGVQFVIATSLILRLAR